MMSSGLPSLINRTRKRINWPIESSVFFNNYYLFLCVLFAPFVAR